MADVKVEGKAITFAVRMRRRNNLLGTLDPKAGEIHGDWFQGGKSLPCHFRAATPAAPDASALTGNWLGTLHVQTIEMRLVLHVKPAPCGLLAVTMDSVDQGANNLPTTAADFRDGKFTFALDYIRASFTGELDPDGKRIAGTFTQGAPVPFTLDRLEGEFSLKRPQEPKPPFPYTEEAVTLISSSKLKDGKNVTLSGTLTMPEGAGPFPAVMMLSGSGAQDRNEALMGHKPFLVIADHLTRAGIAVLRVDDRGVGGSTGSVYETTLSENAGDGLVGLEWLRNHAKIDPRRVGLVGHSEGGWMAPIAASRSRTSPHRCWRPR